MTTPKRGGLGRGLDALMKEMPATAEEPRPAEKAGVLTVPVTRIARNPFQPRRNFAGEGMEDMVRSVKERGIIQPLLVRGRHDGYELIAGERRLRAAEQAGLPEVPVIVIDATDRDSLELALVENVQRQDLNVIEEAEAYKTLAASYNMTQDEIAQRVGKARASVANTMRLLDLAPEVRAMVAEGRLQPGHAKVLLGVGIAAEQVLLGKQVVAENLSVRDLEVLVERIKRAPRKPRATRDDIPANHVLYISDKLRRHLGTSVRVKTCRTLANGKKTKGHIEVEFYSVDDFNRILDLLGVSEQGAP